MNGAGIPRVVVITGASDGIGAEMARQLAAAEGANLALVLAARNAAQLDAVAAECAAFGAQTMTVPTDVGVQIQCRRLVIGAVERFGHIDVLVNNAGRSAHALFEEVEDLGWYEELMRVNLWGAVWCTQAALPHLKRARGSIVAVSSLAGLVGVPGRTAYSATKFAMTGFFEALRAELKGAGVSVTTAYPGVVATKIRYRGFNAQGETAGASGLKEEGAMSVEECARLIIDGMNGRRREVVMTAKGKLGRLLKLLAPGLVEKIALAALKDEVKPH
ncbi:MULTISPECIES: SDR family oxidoreductase [unclassified Massilia]|uniref:SDR family oxidoreductase n=1 Tax=unclassified Massilia TaxID=2609279 RepID=UPI001785C5CA|nr:MULTISPECIES: SDR family oxidoreductase [unclassified Massilia]MBD8533090.1 SDR family oxidoreductase [Massilia sp. CFBP 13647]MBD8676553.1 SDR family oxidoreductase [Massilia sp. CFBP 13721]